MTGSFARKIKCFACICILLMGLQPAQAQQTAIYTDPYRDYKTGLELFGQKKYATAQQFFDLASSKIADDAREELFTYKTYAQYYSAICAIELDNPDAEKLMLTFVEDYPGSALQGAAYYQLGNINFKKKQYTDALNWYDKVDPYDLDREEIDKYRFQYAYCLFTKKRLNEAKPLFLQLRDKQGPYYYPANYYYGFIEYFEGDYDEALKYFMRVKDEGNYALVIPYYICNIYFMKEKYDDLIAYAEPLIENSKLSYYEEINQLLGQAYFYKKDYAAALPYLQYYIDKSRNERAEDYYQVGFAQYKLNDYKSAVASLKEAADDNDTLNQQVMFVLGDCYIKLNKKDDARNAFMEASRTAIDPKVQEHALFNYGKLSYELEYYPAAVTTLTEYLNTYPKGANKTEAQEILAEALLNSKDYAEAISVINGIKDKSPKLKEAYQRVTYYMGVQLYNEKNYKDAEEMFSRSLENKSDGSLFAATYFWLGEIDYSKDKYQLAISDHLKFQDLAKVSKDLPEETSVPFSNYTIGYAYFKTQNYANAAKYFEKTTQSLKVGRTASQQNDVALDATLRLGDCYFVTKSYEKAKNSYQKIIDNNYNGSDYALYQKGMLHGLQKENTSKISAMQQLVSKFPNSLYVDDALYEIANTNFILGRSQDAIDGFKKLLSDKPKSSYTVKAYLKLGLIYYNIGQYDTSEEYYKKAYELSPNSAEGTEAKAALKDIATKTGDVGSLDGIVSKSEKDSIVYYTAKNKYDAADYKGSVSAFNDYIKQYPKGYFKYDALFYRAESNFKQEKYNEALDDYEQIIEANKKQYLESSFLRAAWIAYYQKQDYKTANKYYADLYDVADYKENTFVAMKGLLRTSYFLNEFDDVVTNANRILQSDLVTNDERIEANYYLGKAWIEKNNIDKAYDAFKKAAALTTNEIGVESRFQMADILFQKGKLDDAKKQCLEIVNDMPAYEEWVVRSYILLADISAAKGEYTQAKATLKSIIDNYEGDPDLLELAKQKLEQVEQMEKSDKRVKQQDEGDDDGNNPEELEFNK